MIRIRVFLAVMAALLAASPVWAAPTQSGPNQTDKSTSVTWTFDTTTTATPIFGVVGTCSAKVKIAGSDVLTLYQTNASTATGGTSVATFSATTTVPTNLAIGQTSLYATSTGATGGSTMRIECTPFIVTDLNKAFQTSPSTTVGSDRVVQQITNPATVKYGYGVVTEGGPPYTFTAKNYNGSATDGSEPDNQFGFYYNRCDVFTTTAACTNMFEHAWDWSFENSYRDTATSSETWFEHNFDIKPPDISAPLTSSSTAGWVAGDTLLFSGGGTGQIVSLSGSDPTKTLVWRHDFGTTAAGETVSNITHATSAATLGTLTGTGTYWRPYLSVYKTLGNTMSFYWYTSTSDANPVLSAAAGHATTKGRVIPGTVASSNLTPQALATNAINSGACDTSVTSTATGAVSTDVVRWSYNTSPSTTGGRLIVNPVVSANTITWEVCNPTAGSITPGARSVNWVLDRWL